MERMEVDSSDDLSKVRALGAINFKVGGRKSLSFWIQSTGQIAKLMKFFMND